MSKRKRESIDLKTKYEILQDIERGIDYRVIANKYGLKHKSNISRIKEQKEMIEKAFESGENNSKRKLLRKPKFEDIDEAVIKWLRDVRQHKISISGPLIKETALEIAKNKGIENFVASDGWLRKLKTRHDITFGSVVGESAGVDRNVVSDWLTNRLPEILKDYEPKNIWNADETGLFWRLQPKKTMRIKGETCNTGKLSKERITVLLCTNADGSEKKRLDVIGKSANPRSFGKSKSKLPVNYYNNRKSWMTSDIWYQIMSKLNKKMIKEDRNILMFVDNCTAHPNDLKFPNIKFIYLPSNTTSCTQPLGSGIIKVLKGNYRKLLVRRLLALIECNQEVDANFVTLLDCVLMLRTAWDEVSSTTIANCFRKSGFRFESNIESEEIEADVELTETNDFWPKVMQTLNIECDFNEYVGCDGEVCVSSPTTDTSQRSSEQPNENSDSETDVEIESEVEQKVPNILEVTKAVSTLKTYFLSKDCFDEAIQKNLDHISDKAFECHFNNSRQTKITDFFTK
jgi:hypothetical protein